MKHKPLIFLLVIFLSAIFFIGCDSKKNNKYKYHIGILQFVSHPAIDSIVNGIQDGLDKININNKLMIYN